MDTCDETPHHVIIASEHDHSRKVDALGRESVVVFFEPGVEVDELPLSQSWSALVDDGSVEDREDDGWGDA